MLLMHNTKSIKAEEELIDCLECMEEIVRSWPEASKERKNGRRSDKSMKAKIDAYGKEIKKEQRIRTITTRRSVLLRDQ
jgi:hypothetical protein